VWSIGCIFAELLGRNPIFPGDHYLDQIQKITSVLGSPTNEDLEFVTKKEARDFVLKLTKKKGKPFSLLFPNANPLALDLLSKMLIFNPHRRITIEECIKHDYFKGLHDPAEEPVCTETFDWSFDDLVLTKENLQKMVYEESLHFHPEP
jgi:mitogen-activated protein kinase 1/3